MAGGFRDDDNLEDAKIPVSRETSALQAKDPSNVVATPGSSTPPEMSSEIPDSHEMASSAESQQPVPGTHEWELLSLSQVSLTHPIVEPSRNSAPSLAPSSSVISLGGLGASLVDSSHFDSPEFRLSHASSVTPSGSPARENAAMGASEPASGASRFFDPMADLHQQSPVSGGTGGPMFVMWQREFQSSGSSTGPALLAVSAAGVLSGVTPTIPTASVSQPIVSGQSRAGLPFCSDQLWSSLGPAPINNESPLGHGKFGGESGGNTGSGQVSNLTGSAFFTNESQPMASPLDFNAYSSESFGRESWQVTIPAGTVSFLGSASSGVLNLSPSSLPPCSLVMGPLPHTHQESVAPGREGESRSWTLVQTDLPASPATGLSVQDTGVVFPFGPQNLSNTLEGSGGVDSPEDGLSSFDSEDSLGSESGPEGNRAPAETVDGSVCEQASADLLDVPRRASAEVFQDRVAQREGDTPEAIRAANNQGTMAGGRRNASQRSSWLSLSLGETWWSERGGLVRRIWAGLEEQQGALWATALTAAVVGLVFLAQRWQLERRRNEQLHLLLKKRDDRINQLKAQMVRLTEAMSRQHRVPVIRTSASFPRLSSLG